MSHNSVEFVEGMICCAGCGVEIGWEPVRKYLTPKDFVAGPKLRAQPGGSTGAMPRYLNYCCRECALGECCECGERVRFEEERPPTIYTAFRLEAGRLPAGTRILCVAYERPDFTCQHPSFGPFVARPLTEHVSDPLDGLPVPPGRPTAFFIPFETFVPEARDPGLLVEEVRRFHPDATLVPTGTLPGDASRPLGVVVLVGAGKAVRGNG